MRRSSLLLPLSMMIACGGSSSTSIADPTTGDGGTTDGATADGGGGGGGTTYTLDNVCELTAPKICAIRKPCCDKTFGYDEAACIAEAKADCAKDVAETRGDRMTFHPELVDSCIAKFKPLLEACFSTVDVLYRAFDSAECRVFVGQLDEGAQCERDSQCKAGPAGAFVDCDDATKVCKYTRIFKAGEACRYGDNAGGLCTKGTYCDAPLNGTPGTCKTATALGSNCDTARAIDPSCGLGAYCDKSTGKCTVAKDAGADCETAFECQSLKCENNSGGGRKCQRPTPLVDANECK